MNYETLIWLEPVAKDMQTLLYIVFTIFCISLLVLGVFSLISSFDEDQFDEPITKAFHIWAKRSIIITIISLISLAFLSPITDFTNIYKKVLIYRGINSTLADKTVDTADKALDLLNAKIDKEMKLLDPEQENK